jgi:hypothetical protein
VYGVEGAWFVYGMRLPANLPQIDAYVHNRLRERWGALTQPTPVELERANGMMSDACVWCACSEV